MSTDMREFYQVFFEEAAELLAEKERLLLELDINAPDPEHLNAIFRAAHPIKGGAATFGFRDMTEVTHVAESLLDKIRKGEIRLSGPMVNAFLKAADVIKEQLAGHRGEATPDPAAAKSVCELIRGFSEKSAAVPVAPAPVAEVPAVASAPPAAVTAGAAEESTFVIEFTLPASDARAPLANLLADLESRGKLETVRQPPPGEAGVCHWRLTTGASEEDVWEALAFIVDPAGLSIQKLPASAAARVAPAASPGAGEEFLEPLYKALTEPPAVPASQSAPPGEGVSYGFFASVAAVDTGATATAIPAFESTISHGRRATDAPATDGLRAGRRPTDKVAVAQSSDATSIRVNTEKVDQLINLVGELVITQAMLAQTASKLDPALCEALHKGMGQLERNARDLQESVMAIRMMPISFVFSRFPRLVRDLAAKLAKEVELKLVGEGTELDKGLIEKIADPLTHLVRNSIDHGVEIPAKRRAAGKPEKGTITLRALHQGGSIVIEVADDGAGLNRERILAKARAQGMDVSDAMSDQDVWALIFAAGFSTAEVVTDVSGRGVGMDVVRRNIQALGGSFEIDSALGLGTRMSIRLPLTLAILDGLTVAVGDQTFIIPLTYIVESLLPRPQDIKTVGNKDSVLQVRGEYLPFVRAQQFFNVTAPSRDLNAGIIVILEADGAKKALLVDELLGQQQVVITSLESNYRKVRGISGATILGDGRVGLILDVGALVREVGPDLRVAA